MKKGEAKKVHEGMEREETQESEGEKDYFWSCACLSRSLDIKYQHTLIVFSMIFNSVAVWIFLVYLL